MDESVAGDLTKSLIDPKALENAFSSIPWLLPVIGIIILFFFLLYIYSALTLMFMAKKLESKNSWMAWIPFANIYLMWEISETPQWTMIVYFIGIFCGFLPFIGGLISIGISALAIFWYWRICERLGKPGWWSIFSLVFFPAWLIMIGILAWGNTTLTKIPPVGTQQTTSVPEPPKNPDQSDNSQENK